MTRCTFLKLSTLWVLFLCLSGCASTLDCSPYIGLAVHPESIDAPEYYAPNPIGIVGYECTKGEYTVYIEHKSSIPYYEQGGGLNTLAVKKNF